MKAEKSKPMFIIRNWHRPYAQALLEADPVKLALLVREAEIAILCRFLEPSARSIQADEILDLQNAVEVLSKLRSSVIEAIPAGDDKRDDLNKIHLQLSNIVAVMKAAV
jgi:hypothetical protein